MCARMHTHGCGGGVFSAPAMILGEWISVKPSPNSASRNSCAWAHVTQHSAQEVRDAHDRWQLQGLEEAGTW